MVILDELDLFGKMTEKTLENLKKSSQINQETPYSYRDSKEKDSHDKLDKGKVIESLIANGNSLLQKLFNQQDEKRFASRNLE